MSFIKCPVCGRMYCVLTKGLRSLARPCVQCWFKLRAKGVKS